MKELRLHNTEAAIRARISSPLEVVSLANTDSTNRVARELAAENAPETLITADSQSSGRGRLGRSFFSPDGGLYMSLLLYPERHASAATLLTTAAAVATAKAIESLTGESCTIKWVNDIYLRGKKVCGILTEGQIDPETGMLAYAIVGIGVNICEPDGGFPPEIADRAGVLFTDGTVHAPELRVRLTAEIVNGFYGLYARLEKCEFIDDYRKRQFLIGRRVNVISPDESTREADVLALDDDFRLVVQYPDGGREALGAGDVSLKI